MNQSQILLCTVGTSLFKPNLENLKKELNEGRIKEELRPLATAYQERDWSRVAQHLARLPASERVCGAEINSVASMLEKQYVVPGCGLFFFHSATTDGRDIACVLQHYYRSQGHAPVETVEVPDLQDQEPKRFRTKGLRNLARELCRVLRNYSVDSCAINATGGYKAQIAVAVLIGQAIGVPVYYKHELFSEIIAFPPMPVSLDFEVWLQANGMLFDLERSSDPIPAAVYAEDWNEKYESLVERVSIDGIEYLDLSPTGQIFHETFRERFRVRQQDVLPAPARKKLPPHLEDAGWPGKHPEVRRYLERITEDVPYVVRCATYYYNPDLSERIRFRRGRDGIEGIYSNGSYTVKFRVETTASTNAEQNAVIAYLNEWLAGYLSKNSQ